LDPSPLDVEMEDIAHGLARVARWNGQTEGAHIFSVAQHSLLVETIARHRSQLDRQGRLAVLLHDAPEYVIGDMISPFKAVIGNNYKEVEARLLAAIYLRFGLPAEPTAELLKVTKIADQAAAWLEATKLAGFSVPEATRFFGKPPALSMVTLRDYLTPWPAETAETLSGTICAAVRPDIFATRIARYTERHGDSRLLPVPPASNGRGDRRATSRRFCATSISAAADSITADRHLVLGMDDIPEPADGYIAPGENHVATLIAFARAWDRSAPLVVHCYAGISRSTAGAFVTACALNPGRAEASIAQEYGGARNGLAQPPHRLDCRRFAFGRNGRMVDAINAIGSGAAAHEAVPFHLELE
jgi:predicted protein tyrosine phosphatase/5'-deoxynucleotidase YfbR-like HD superfamily hydrolase